MASEPLLEIRDIHAGYGKRKVLFGIEMKIQEGTSTLLIGPNGSGKSTLIKVIAGILKPEKGSVIYKGNDITYLPPEKRVETGIGYLKQTRNIFPYLTVRENLEIGGYGLKRQEMEENIEKILSYFPFLKEKMKQRAGLLSGGERQALALGIVLMKDKEFLLLDEPTAGLSPLSAKEILKSIQHIQKEEKKTILMVEHNLKIAFDLADRMIFMKNGKIVKEVSQKETFAREIKDIEKIFFE